MTNSSKAKVKVTIRVATTAKRQDGSTISTIARSRDAPSAQAASSWLLGICAIRLRRLRIASGSTNSVCPT